MNIKVTLLIILVSINSIKSQNNMAIKDKYWQVGIGLGEIPMKNSFKPSFTIGYHFNANLYAGIIYQFKDKISRNNSSFNVASSELEGLVRSSENVGNRFMFQLRITPLKYLPYISTGFVFNGQDKELMHFGTMNRIINNENYSGDISIEQERLKGWGFALGLGYQYDFKNRFSLNFEWTPAWFQGYPKVKYKFSGTSNLSNEAKENIKQKMDEGFSSTITNYYKVFHFGLAYRFP
ncbi:MAG: hypothetical protein WAO74_11600 [Polaribacter sp.]|uniref:hypothetical protein n=1 Tax=Polaribacter sp. TaxID=1920175 RepID=UPI003BAEB4ED